MLGKVLGNRQWKGTQRLLATLLMVVLSLSLVSCRTPEGGVRAPGSSAKPRMVKLSEVPAPPAIRELRQALEIYQPQVKILSPRADEVLQDTEVSVRLQEKDLPLFQDKKFGLGPHLHVILDNQPYIAVYDTSEPLLLKDLEPGTHTIRVFASRPWHESFKNEGAYAQTTFHVFTKTPENNPDLQPLLTYSRPKGSYGAEPIMLDFYLTNAPLHLVAKQDEADDILDWQVRCTINGESFMVDRWEPIYLKGLKPGKTWVQLELLDEKGTPYPNVFNNTARLIDYQPGGTDALSKLVRGEISVAEIRSIVDQDYVYVPEPIAPEPVESEPIEPEPDAAPSPSLLPEPTLEPVLPGTLPIPVPEVMPPEAIPPIVEEPIPEPSPEKIPTPASVPPVIQTPTVQKVEEAEDKVKEQLPEAVGDFLSKQEDSSPLSAPIVPQPGHPEVHPVLDPSEPPLPAPAANKPFLRQWRDRLKQIIPLPEPGVKDESRGLNQPQPAAPIEEADPALKLPQIIDVPPDEKLDTQIAEPEPVPVEPSLSPQAAAPLDPDTAADLAQEASDELAGLMITASGKISMASPNE